MYANLTHKEYKMQIASQRLTARVKPDTYSLIKRAAEIEGVSLTDFIIGHLQKIARQTISQAEVIELSLKDQQQFARSLNEPYQPNQALQTALADYEKRFGK